MSTRHRILVIDDDPLFRSLIVALLRKDHFVSVAGEGSEGFYKALEHPPDIAVVDIQMPGWDGLRTLKAFRGHPELQHVKVMILTSDASKETVLAAIHGGANDYLIKTSFNKAEFYEKLGRLIQSSRTNTPHSNDGERARASAANLSNNRMDDGALLAAPAQAPAASRTTASAVAHADDPAKEELQSLIDGWE